MDHDTGASLSDQVLALVSDNIELAEPIVFAIAFAESLIFVSLFVPSTALLLIIGGLHAAAGGTFWPVWIAGAIGATLGDFVSFAMGHNIRRGIRQVWPFSAHPVWYVNTRFFIVRWGALGIIGSKFLGMLRPFVPVVAGAMRMRWWTFLIASPISALLWAGTFLVPGYGLTWFFS